MPIDWEGLDEVDAAERLLGQSVEDRAEEIRIDCGREGADIYFVHDGEPCVFAQLPQPLADKVCHYLRGIAALEEHKGKPQEGICDIVLGASEFTLTVQAVPGASADHLALKLCRL